VKVTKRQLRRIIKEERSRLLNEQIPPDDPYASVGGPDPSPNSVENDAMIVVDQLEYAFQDSLEELGVGAQAATSIENFLKTTAYLDTAFEKGLENYKKKLKMMGGMPKPRSV
jgi:hypothetical protein